MSESPRQASESELSHWAWGFRSRFPDDDLRRGLAEQIGAFLGVPAPALRPLPRVEEARLPEPRLPIPHDLLAFSSASREERLQHTYGRAYRDVLRGFQGDFSPAPDLVAIPRDEAEISAVLAAAEREGLAVIPYGGGTSVVGGVEGAVGAGYAGVVSLDLRLLNRVLEVDSLSLAARIQAGCRGPAIEEALSPHGLVLRHYPQSFEHSTLGGWLATRAGGHFATLFTHIDDFVESIRMVTPRGAWESRRLPASGAGPSPDRLALGSEGILGVISEAWIRVLPKPRYRASATVRFERFMDGAAACRLLAQSGLHPANCRLLDATEAFLAGVPSDGGSVLLLAFESADHALGAFVGRALEIAEGAGGTRLGEPVLRDAGEKGRAEAASTYRDAFFRMPYMQSALVSLGIIADTFETACTWDRYPELAKNVRAAVRAKMTEVAGAGVLACRFTHVYPDGPAPYFTFLAPGRPGQELSQWTAIKEAANQAISESGGTITHHHAVGRLHRPTYERERPAPFALALGGAKRAVDPGWILNPGVLLAGPPEVDPQD